MTKAFCVLLICLCAVQFVSGENSRLHCKSVSGDPAGTQITDADYIVLNASIGSVFDDLSLKMQMMEERIFTRLHSYFMDVQRNMFSDIRNAVIHEGKYYWAVIRDAESTNYAEAEIICMRRGGKPADIHDNAQLRLIREYIVLAMENQQTSVSLWLGMTYNHLSGHLKYSYGKLAPKYDWYPGYPKENQLHKAMALTENRDKNEKRRGVFNHSPSATTHGVLCEK